MQELISDIHELIPTISEYRVYKVICSIRGRYNKYGNFGLGKRDGPKFGISERQMPKLINLLLEYGFIDVKCEVSHRTRGFRCRVFNMSDQFKKFVLSIKDFVKKKFEYINPAEFVKGHFQCKIKSGNIEFKVNGDKYIIHKRGRFKGKIFGITEYGIIAPYNLI